MVNSCAWLKLGRKKVRNKRENSFFIGKEDSDRRGTKIEKENHSPFVIPEFFIL
jgi:hypothetical protein